MACVVLLAGFFGGIDLTGWEKDGDVRCPVPVLTRPLVDLAQISKRKAEGPFFLALPCSEPLKKILRAFPLRTTFFV